MHSILSFSKLSLKILNSDISIYQNDKLSRYSNNINQSGKRLLRLINNLLDIEKLLSGKIEFCPKYIDFNEVLTSVLSEMEGYTSDKKIQILVDDKCSESTVWAEEHLILQVLVNLLSNAIKFSPKNGIVVIGITNTVKECENVIDSSETFLEVKIIDQGPGVPENEFNSIFDQFVQSSTTQVGTGGTGLGLAISQHILELHHGEIQVTNMESSGACFFFSLATKQFDNLS